MRNGLIFVSIRLLNCLIYYDKQIINYLDMIIVLLNKTNVSFSKFLCQSVKNKTWTYEQL